MSVHCVLDLREIGVDCLTVGQYMQPTRRHLKVSHLASILPLFRIYIEFIIGWSHQQCCFLFLH